MRKGVVGISAASVAVSLAAASSVRAASGSDASPMMVYLGYNTLVDTYGASLAKGDNVNVSIVEASGYPDATDGRFSGKNMIKTVSTTGADSHATNVGSRFFGNTSGFSQRSVAPNVGNNGSSVQMYTYSQWAGSWYLDGGSPEPYGSFNQSRVSSHAYASSDTSLDTATRLDYTTQRDDFLHVFDTTEYSTEGNTFNSVVITPAQGTATKTAGVGGSSVYTAGRVSPTVTGPLTGAGSDAIGQTAGVVALLMSRGKTTNSNYTYTTASTIAVQAPYSGSFVTAPQAGYLIHSGDTAEVIKASLMAGALRTAPSDGTLGVPGISDYRASAGNQSVNGLDTRFGAGMVNALQSYRIVDAGEFNSAQDGLSNVGQSLAGGIGQYGFDYDQAFGGAGGSNSTANYGFTANATGKFMASLVWNVKIAGAATAGGNFDPTATLYNLDLTLTDLTTSTVVQTSASTVDNTENLWTDLVAGHQYLLTVSANGTPFNWDYGLAWRGEVGLTPLAVPEPATLGAVGVIAGLGLMGRRRRA